jgi:hypothetical protein
MNMSGTGGRCRVVWRSRVVSVAALALAISFYSAAAQNFRGQEDYSRSNSVTILFDDPEEAHGLKHHSAERDGLTQLEGYNGVTARASRLTGDRTSLFFYFSMDAAFKTIDLRWARIEVEYLALESGTMGVHYDKVDPDSTGHGRYQEASSPIPLVPSPQWRKATFRTKGDGGFANRENGLSDFRIWAKTPQLYVRRVTVTREHDPDAQWLSGFGRTNAVSAILGREKPEVEGLRHLPDAAGGHTTVEFVGGVPCRYLNRLREMRLSAALYFAISPSFKQPGLKNARVEIEYLTKTRTYFRLQYDAMDGQSHRTYRPALPENALVTKLGMGADYAISAPGTWRVATFHLKDAVFENSQRDGADFRIEVIPSEIYVRRVTVVREPQ